MDTKTGKIIQLTDEEAKKYKEEFGEDRLKELDKEILALQKQLGKKKIGRNDLCPCGSGNKFKKCCLNGDGKGNSAQKVERLKLTNTLKLGTKVTKNEKTWVSNGLDVKGRGEGIGVVVRAPFQLANNEVNVQWPNIRSFEYIEELVVLGKKDE